VTALMVLWVVALVVVAWVVDRRDAVESGADRDRRVARDRGGRACVGDRRVVWDIAREGVEAEAEAVGPRR
jgi:hypothetical protein